MDVDVIMRNILWYPPSSYPILFVSLFRRGSCIYGPDYDVPPYPSSSMSFGLPSKIGRQKDSGVRTHTLIKRCSSF